MSGGVRLAWWPRPIWEIPVTDLVVMTQEIEQAFVKAALETLPGAQLGVGKRAKSGASGGRQAAGGNWGNLLDAPATPDELMQIARLLPNTVVDWEFWNTNLMRFFAASHGATPGRRRQRMVDLLAQHESPSYFLCAFDRLPFLRGVRGTGDITLLGT